jgi:hypothetical protein
MTTQPGDGFPLHDFRSWLNGVIDATVGARLEALGFEVVVSEPKAGKTRVLVLFDDYIHEVMDNEGIIQRGHP